LIEYSITYPLGGDGDYVIETLWPLFRSEEIIALTHGVRRTTLGSSPLYRERPTNLDELLAAIINKKGKLAIEDASSEEETANEAVSQLAEPVSESFISASERKHPFTTAGGKSSLPTEGSPPTANGLSSEENDSDTDLESSHTDKSASETEENTGILDKILSLFG
jgi:hypothetical protein